MAGDPHRELAAVEVVGALDSEPFERVRQLGHGEALADPQRLARPVERVALRRVAEQRIEDLVQEPLHVVEDDALAGELHGRREQVGPRHRSPAGGGFPEAENGAGNGHRHRARVEDLLRVAVVDDDLDELRRRGRGLALRDRHEEVEQLGARLGRVVDEQEAAAARTGERALADPRDGGRRDAGVHGVPARAQDVRSRRGGERVTGCQRASHEPSVRSAAMGDVSFAADERLPWWLRLPTVREAALCTGLGATTASLLVWFGPRGGDLAAHEYQLRLFLHHGLTLWDNFWYAGRYAYVDYSVLYYPLAAVFGIALLTVLTVALAAGAFARLLEREWGPAARWAGRSFALLWPGVILAAELPLALGVLFALLCLLALQAGRRWTGAALILLTLASSPVAFVLLAVVLAGVAAGRHPGLRLRAVAVPAAAVAVAAAAELLTLHLFPVGTLGFPADEAVQAAAFCIVLLALTWRLERARGLRGVSGRLPAGRRRDLPDPDGARTRHRARAPARSSDRAARRGAAALAAAAARAWWLSRSRPPGTCSPWRARGRAARRTARPIRGCGPLPWATCTRTCGRATGWRPWTRSITGRRCTSPGRTFRSCAAGSGRTTIPWPRSSITATTAAEYMTWLHRLGVEYVVLTDAPPDHSSRREARLVRSGTTGLSEVFAGRGVRIYAVPQPQPIVTGPGRPAVLALRESRLRLRVSRGGTYLVAVRWSPYWHASTGCLMRAPGGLVRLRTHTAATVRIAFDVDASSLFDAFADLTPTCPKATRPSK